MTPAGSDVREKDGRTRNPYRPSKSRQNETVHLSFEHHAHPRSGPVVRVVSSSLWTPAHRSTYNLYRSLKKNKNFLQDRIKVRGLLPQSKQQPKTNCASQKTSHRKVKAGNAKGNHTGEGMGSEVELLVTRDNARVGKKNPALPAADMLPSPRPRLRSHLSLRIPNSEKLLQ